MSIKDTYGGQWSDDLALLENLVNGLKGSDCIVVAESFKKGQRHVRALYHDDDELQRFLCSKTPIKEFLLPSPRPEPSKLVWRDILDGEESVAEGNGWVFSVDADGSWGIMFNGKYIAGQDDVGTGTLESGKAAVHAWRVKFLEGMTGWQTFGSDQREISKGLGAAEIHLACGNSGKWPTYSVEYRFKSQEEMYAFTKAINNLGGIK